MEKKLGNRLLEKLVVSLLSTIGTLSLVGCDGGNVYDTGLEPYVVCSIREPIGIRPLYDRLACDNIRGTSLYVSN